MFFLFFNAVRALTSGGFPIVSDTLVLTESTNVTDGQTDGPHRHRMTAKAALA